MNWGPPPPPGHGFPPAEAAGGYFDLAIAFGVLFAIFFTVTVFLTVLLCYLVWKINTTRPSYTRGQGPGNNLNYGS